MRCCDQYLDIPPCSRSHARPSPRFLRSTPIETLLALGLLLGGAVLWAGEDPGDEEAAPKPNRKEEHLFRYANTVYEKGLYDLAIDAFADYLKKHPQSKERDVALFRLGESYCQVKLRAKAIPPHTELCNKFQTSKYYVKGLFRLGESLFLTHDYRGCVKWTEEFLKARKDQEKELVIPAQYCLGMSYYRIGSYTPATKPLTEVAKTPSFARWDIAVFHLADIHSREKAWQEAAKWFKQLTTRAKKSELVPEATLRLAHCYLELKQYEPAIAAYRAVPRGGDQEDEALYGEASALYHQKNLAGAAKVYTQLGTKFRDKSDYAGSALYLAGSCYYALGKYDEAIKSLESLSPGVPGAALYLRKAAHRTTLCYYYLGKWEAAITQATKFLQRSSPEDKELKADVHYVLAEAYYKTEKFSQAAANYEKVTEGCEFYVNARYRLGLAYHEAKNRQKSAQVFDAFCQNYPDQKQYVRVALIKAAEAYFELKNYTETRKRYESLLAAGLVTGAEAEGILYAKGVCEQLLKEHDEMAKTFQQLLKQFPRTKLRGNLLYWCARNHQRNRQYTDAAKLYEQATKDAGCKYKSEALYDLGRSYYAAKNLPKAAEVFLRIMNDEPTILKGSDPKGQIAHWVGQYYAKEAKAPKTAIAALSKALEMYPKKAPWEEEALYQLGYLYNQETEWEKCVATLDTLTQRHAAKRFLGHVTLLKAVAHQELQDFGKAIPLYQNLLQGPEGWAHAKALLELGKIYYAKEQFDVALREYLIKAEVIFDDEQLCSEAMYYSALSMEKLKRPVRDTRQELEELIERYPKTPFADKARKKLKELPPPPKEDAS